MAQQNHIIVAAIDFGTTFSGYAFSFKDNPKKVITNEDWVDESGCLSTFKTPTTILFDKEGKFHSFGYDAEHKYATLAEKAEEDESDEESEDKDDSDKSDDGSDKSDSKDNDGPTGWKYFKRFKMNLYRQFDEQNIGKRINRNMMLKDDQGNKMEALKVFSSAIKFISDDFFKNFKDKLENVNPSDVLWVITVPAIWSDAAKQFMREAAGLAGIPHKQLTLALEPEAATIYCKEASVRKKEEKGQATDLESFKIGESFLLLDIGGGTVDITCHEIVQDGKLKEKHRPTGGPWGGTVVDAAFFNLLKNIVGPVVWKEFTDKKLSESLELQRVFEVKKRHISDDEDTVYKIKIGKSLLKLFKKHHNKTLKRSLSSKDHEYNGKITFGQDKIKIKKDFFLTLFEEPISAIMKHVKELLKKDGMRDVKTIMMVGGFSESKLMIKRVKAAFPELQVICPPMANLAVLQGAVIYGHSPELISERTSPRTYGICVSIPFVEGIHPDRCRFFNGEELMCTDVFKVMINLDEPVIPGQTVKEHTCRPSRASDSMAVIEIYESFRTNPDYTVDSSCRRLGVLEIDIPDTSKGKDRLIKIQFHFGFTTLKVTAVEEGTNNKAEVKFDCLSGS